MPRKSELQAKIVELENRLKGYSNQASTPTLPPHQQDLSEEAAVAVITVAQMLENKAEVMAVRVGSDVAAYKALVEEAHDLRSALGWINIRYGHSSLTLDAQATSLYERLSK